MSLYYFCVLTNSAMNVGYGCNIFYMQALEFARWLLDSLTEMVSFSFSSLVQLSSLMLLFSTSNEGTVTVFVSWY